MNTIYHYWPDTGEQASTGHAYPSPLETDVYLIPAYATPDAPPPTAEREAALYRDGDGNVPAHHETGAWRVVPDWRGVPLWSTSSGEPHAIIEPGITPADIGATELAPPSPDHAWDGSSWALNTVRRAQRLAERRTILLAAITVERDRREEAGFPYRGTVLDSTPRSVQRITAAALAAQAALAAGQPFSIDWTCADNSVLALDAPGVIGMPVALAQHAAALHAHARTLKTAVDAAGSEEALAAIDIHAGWPGETA